MVIKRFAAKIRTARGSGIRTPRVVCLRSRTTYRHRPVIPKVEARPRLSGISSGRARSRIALRLEISQRTVESYRVRIMDKMQAESVAVLVRQAIRLGRITP